MEVLEVSKVLASEKRTAGVISAPSKLSVATDRESGTDIEECVCAFLNR